MIHTYDRLAMAFCIFCFSCSSAKINTKINDSLPATTGKIKIYFYPFPNIGEAPCFPSIVKRGLKVFTSAVTFLFTGSKGCALAAEKRQKLKFSYFIFFMETTSLDQLPHLSLND